MGKGRGRGEEHGLGGLSLGLSFGGLGLRHVTTHRRRGMVELLCGPPGWLVTFP